ncbi:MAG: hypothetical protein P8181_16025, partial [bacterium]
REIRKLGGHVPTRSEGPDADMVNATSFLTDDAVPLGFDNGPTTPGKDKPPRLAIAAMRRAIAEMTTPDRRRPESDAVAQEPPDSDLRRDSWYRIQVSDGIEIHYRAGADDAAGKINRLIACARQIFRR